MSEQDRLFALRIASIASIERGAALASCNCLVCGEGEAANAVARELEGRARRADRAPHPGDPYDLIVLLGEGDEAVFAFAAPDALVLDAAPGRGHRAVYDPKQPLRRVRVLALPSS